MNEPNITAVIQTYGRPDNLKNQIRSLKGQSIPPEEIIVLHVENEHTNEFNFGEANDVYFVSDPGPRTHMIGALAHDNDTDFISLLDDDIIPGGRWYEFAVECFERHPGIYGGSVGMYYDGVQKRRHRSYYPDSHSGSDAFVQVDFVGQHWFLTPEQLSYFFKYTMPFEVSSGDDDIWLGYCAYKEGIKCIVPPFPGGEQMKWGTIGRPNSGDETALHNRYEDHAEDRQKLIEWCRDNGWDVLGTEVDPDDKKIIDIW